MATSSSHIASTSVQESDCMFDDEHLSPVLNVGKRRVRSTVWIDFKRFKLRNGNHVSVCNHCDQRLTAGSGTSNMRTHLRRCKGKKNELESSPSSRLKFDQDRSRRDLCRMIIKHEYCFAMVDHAYFRIFINNLQPLFDLKHRTTVTTDCMDFYKEMRNEIYESLGNNQSRISLTTDLWTSSNTMDSYMCLTCHYIDNDWVLQAKVLDFKFMDSNHTGEELCRTIMGCMISWNIDKKISTITVDNATNNDTMIAKVKIILNRDKSLILNGLFIQIRCACHVLNLIVKDGLDTLGFTLENIRLSVKYVLATAQRKLKWKAACSQVDIKTEKGVFLDNQIRWNSTYEMLEVALEHEEAFNRLEKRELDFNTNPSREEWAFARLVCSCLKVFYDSTQIFSGRQYPTADLLFSEVCEIHLCLMEWQKSEYILIQNMADIMMLKFRKYWTECSMILAVAYVLNPGCKMKFVENYYTEIHGLSSSKTYSDRVVSALYAIYSEYAPPSSSLHTVQASGSHTVREVYSENLASSKAKRMASWYQREGIGNSATKSELEQYLDESLSPLKGMSILDWWKVNSPKYPHLSKMARDILCIPVSSVPSEAAFSNGGRVLCDSRASLGHNTIEALICGESWIPNLSSPKNILEDFNQLSFADAEDDGGSAAEEGYTTYNDDDYN